MGKVSRKRANGKHRRAKTPMVSQSTVDKVTGRKSRSARIAVEVVGKTVPRRIMDAIIFGRDEGRTHQNGLPQFFAALTLLGVSADAQREIKQTAAATAKYKARYKAHKEEDGPFTVQSTDDLPMFTKSKAVNAEISRMTQQCTPAFRSHVGSAVTWALMTSFMSAEAKRKRSHTIQPRDIYRAIDADPAIKALVGSTSGFPESERPPLPLHTHRALGTVVYDVAVARAKRARAAKTLSTEA